MSLQKKCLTASAITHGLLLLLVLVGSAFVPQKPKVEGPVFELIKIPEILIDAPNLAGGGNPNALPPPANTPLLQQQPAPIPPAPKPEPEKAPPIKTPEPEPVKQKQPAPELEKSPVAKVPKIDPDAFDLRKAVRKEKTTPTKPETAFDLKAAHKLTIKRAPEKDASDESRIPERDNSRTEARSGVVSEALKRMQGGLSSVNANYDIPGPGGAAYASYHLALHKIYENAWIPPTASRGNEPMVEVEVVIRKDGRVLERRILKKSGRAELDRSVQNTLNRVGTVPPFPAGSTDERRTFRFNFDLTSKLNLG